MALKPIARAERATTATVQPDDGLAVIDARDVLRLTAQAATVGLFILGFGVFLSLARTLVMPVLAALFIGVMLSPLARRAERWGVPSLVVAFVVVGLFIAAINFATISLSSTVGSLITQAPEIGPALKQKFEVFAPLVDRIHNLVAMAIPANGDSALKFDVAAALQYGFAFLTPAVGELLLFLVTLLLFMVSRDAIRRNAIMFFSRQHNRLAVIRITNDIEEQLTRYIGTVTAINLCMGVLVAVGCYFIGFSNPVLLGVLAFAGQYIPYVGPTVTLTTLLVAGLIAFPSLGYALLAPALFLGLVICEGQFVTPQILGRRFTVNPLSVFLSLAFWSWLWGPIGAFLSVPLLIAGVAVLSHFSSKTELPG